MNASEESWPAWLQLLLAGITGAVLGTGTIIKLAFNFNTRLQRLENQDLNSIIDARISADWHANRAPVLQSQLYIPMDKMEDELKRQGQNIAVLLDRNNTASAIEKAIATAMAHRFEGPTSKT